MSSRRRSRSSGRWGRSPPNLKDTYHSKELTSCVSYGSCFVNDAPPLHSDAPSRAGNSSSYRRDTSHALFSAAMRRCISSGEIAGERTCRMLQRQEDDNLLMIGGHVHQCLPSPPSAHQTAVSQAQPPRRSPPTTIVPPGPAAYADPPLPARHATL